MEREIKTIKTPNGHEVEMYTYITGREMRDIQNIFLEKTTMSVKGKQAEMSAIPANLSSRAEDKTISLLVVSVDGQMGNSAKFVGDLRLEDYDAVMKELNSMTSVKKPESDTSEA